MSRPISHKTRLTPIKTKRTIPLLETLGILFAARLPKTIVEATATRIQQVILVSDSKLALG